MNSNRNGHPKQPTTAADLEREPEVLASIIRADTAELPPNLARVLACREHIFTGELRQISDAVARVRDEGQDPVNAVTLGRILHGDTLLALSMVLQKADSLPAVTDTIAEQEAGELLKAVPPEVLAAVRIEAPEPWLSLVEDGAELQARDVPAVVEIVEAILPEQAKLSIVSSAKCFKSWTTIYMALAISHGIEFLGRRTSRRKVIYVNLELKTLTFTRRLQAIAKALGIEIEADWFLHIPLRGQLAGLTVHEIITRIIRLAKRFGATVIVVDPLFKLNIEGEENSSRDQTVFCNELDRLTTEGGCTAIFNDHSGKGNQSEKDPLDVIRGSSAKGGDLDAAMVLRRHEVAECFRVDLIHRELAPVEPFVIGWEYPLMRLRSDLSAEDMKKPKGGRPKNVKDPEQLCAFISGTTAENGVSISAWAKTAGITRQTLQGYLPGLRAKGWINTAGEGNGARQYLTEKGQQAARRFLGDDNE